MTDEDVEKIIKRNMNLQMNLAGIRADFEEAQQRTWVGLPHEDFTEACQMAERGNYLVAFQRIQAKLKELNT
jgi:hypothetical protein